MRKNSEVNRNMVRDLETRMTVKEWAEKAGLKLYNYDGFMDIYSRLSENSSNDFETRMAERFRDAGELVCTRKAFESRIIYVYNGVSQNVSV